MPTSNLDALSDRLVDLIREGNPLPDSTVALWWVAAYEYSYGRAVGWCSRSPGLEPDEIAQLTVTGLYPRFPAALAQLRCKFSTYLYTATRNVLNDALRALMAARQNRVELDDASVGALESAAPDPEQLTVLKRLLAPVIEALTRNEQAILVQVVKESSVEEAMERTTYSRATFFREKEKLLKKLRRLLREGRLMIR